MSSRAETKIVAPHVPAPAYRRFDSGLAVALLFLVTASVNLEMPLYRAYAARAGSGYGMTALMFAAYIAGLLPCLLLLGGLSDRLGRKPVMAACLAAALGATLLMIREPAMRTLYAARVLQGIGVGLAVGAGTAYLAEALGGERAAQRAAGRVAIATSLGFGGGALFTGTCLLFSASPQPASYLAHAVAAAICLALIAFLRTAKPQGGPLLRLPHFPSGTLPAGLAIALAWAATGAIISLMPAQLARHGLSAWAGHALFLVNGTGALMQPWARKLDARKALRMGAAFLPSGYAALCYGAWSGSLAAVFAGASLAGAACYGFTYLGGLAEVSQRGGAARARAVSGFFALAYLGFGLPSVGLGFLSDRFGLTAVLAGFGIALAILCAVQAWWAKPAPAGR